jgi:hypothetical protein
MSSVDGARLPEEEGEMDRDAPRGAHQDEADIGRPIAYLALPEGTPVVDREGRRIGVVDHVVADVDLDLFYGVVVHTRPLPGRHLYADRDQICGLYERAVLLAADVDDLHEPREPDPRRRDGHPRDVETLLETGLRKSWDWITGRR